MHDIMVKRVYEEPAGGDGTRVLVDRLWPRGVAKEEARVEYWLRDLAPSVSLRRWFGHDPAKWGEFSAPATTRSFATIPRQSPS